MIPKGLFAYRSTGFRLMFLLILLLFFGSLSQMIGLMLTSGSGSVSLQDVVSEDGLQAHTVGARNVLRILQVLFVSGVFILAPGPLPMSPMGALRRRSA